MALDDLMRYQYGALAQRLSQSEQGQEFIPSTLEKLGSSLNEDAALSTGIAIKHGGVEDIISAYSGKYQKAFESTILDELLQVYGGVLENYLDVKEASKIREEIAKFSSATVGDIREKLNKSQYILMGKQTENYNFSDEEVENAENTFERYGKINNIVELLESIKFENLRPSAVKGTYQQKLKEIAEKL